MSTAYACRYVHINSSDLIYTRTRSVVTQALCNSWYGIYAYIHPSILHSCQEKLHISQEVPDYLLPLKYKAHMTVILQLKLLNNSNRAVFKLLYLQIF